jgi:hypothetical protein
MTICLRGFPARQGEDVECIRTEYLGLSRQSTTEHEKPGVKRQARRGSKKGTRGVKKKKTGLPRKAKKAAKAAQLKT